MATLDKVMELQAKGISEEEISKQLQNDGVSPKEILDALSQARIKNAVSPQTMTNEQENSEMNNQMQQSIMQAPSNEQANYSPQYDQMQQPTQEIPMQQPQIQQTQQAYSGQEYYPQQQSYSDVETITEISEQVVHEKFAEFTRKTGDILGFKNLVIDELKNLDERLKRIETTIDKLQQAIIGRLGDFGDNTTAIRKDIENLHNTTSKLMNPLIDNYKELKKIVGKK